MTRAKTVTVKKTGKVIPVKAKDKPKARGNGYA